MARRNDAERSNPRASGEAADGTGVIEREDVRIVAIEVPIADETSRFARMDLKIERSHARTLCRVAEALRRNGVRLKNDKFVETPDQALMWMCEQLGE